MDANGTYSLADIKSAVGDADGFGGNWVLILLFAMIFGWGGNGFGGNGSQTATSADLQRAIDLNSIQEGQANIMSDIQRGIYEINGATKDSAYNNLSEIRDVQASVATNGANIINALTAMQANMQNCCCETKQTIMENRYLDSQNANAIMANSTANAQKILDAISTNRMADMQSQINALQLQNAVSGVVRYPQASTYSVGYSPFCSCGTSGNI